MRALSDGSSLLNPRSPTGRAPARINSGLKKAHLARFSRGCVAKLRARVWKTGTPVQKLAPFLRNMHYFGLDALEKPQSVRHADTVPAQPGLIRRRMMTQSQVAAHLADKVGMTKKQAKSALEELTSLVVRELKKEGSLRLAGLGIFRKRQSKARMGRNPATGEAIKIPARTRLRFTAAKALKDSVLGARKK
jgi:DNA-binding protein HU-beta